jgi:hypothetical protein
MLPSDPLPALKGEVCLLFLSDPSAEVRLFQLSLLQVRGMYLVVPKRLEWPAGAFSDVNIITAVVEPKVIPALVVK